MIHFTAEHIDMPVLDQARISRWIRAVAAEYGFGVGNLNYIFCTDERELEVNRSFLGHDYYTHKPMEFRHVARHRHRLHTTCKPKVQTTH